MTTQRLTPQQEFNQIPPYVRDRLIAWQKHRKIEAAAAAVGCNRDTMRETLKQYGDLMVRLILSQDNRSA